MHSKVLYKELTKGMQKRVSALVLLFLMSALNAAPEKEPTSTQAQSDERAAYLDPELKQQLALAGSLKEHEIVWLEVSYPDSTQAQKTLAIAHPSLIAEEQGAILLIHDKEQHADWPQIIRPLRKILPEAGWFTLSVSLPDDTRIKLPERLLAAKEFDQVLLSDSLKVNLDSGLRKRDSDSTSADNKSSTETTEAGGSQESNESVEENASSEESVDIDLAAAQKQDQNKIPYDVRALSHIEKALDYLKGKDYQNIVMIAHRQSVELVLNYIKAHRSELATPGVTFVFIEPLVDDAYLLNLTEWLGESFNIPILEVINRSNSQAGEQAKSREFAMQRAGAQTFRQLFLTVSNSEVFNESLSRRVKLWLDVNSLGKTTTQ